jgi:hypothetical protein
LAAAAEDVFDQDSAAGAQSTLEATCGVVGTDIDGEIEKLRPNGSGQVRIVIAFPPVSIVDSCRLLTGKRRDIHVRILSTRDSEAGFATGIGLIIRIATFVSKESGYGAEESRWKRRGLI